jgi:hypothetical protein
MTRSSASRSGSESPPRAPLIIGVTGHRDLRKKDVPELESLVDDVLKDLKKNYPETPIVLLTPLAEGADRLVARVALRRLRKQAHLIAVLPRAQADYEKDFETQESLDEFHGLLKKTTGTIELPAVGDDKVEYALMGAYIARHSRILIALWDGLKGDPGGTADVVGFQQKGRFDNEVFQDAYERLAEPLGPGDDPLDAPEAGMVVHIVTPRQSKPGQSRPVPARAFETIKHAPGRRNLEAYSEALHVTHERLNTFNQDLRRLWEATARAREQRQQELMADSDWLPPRLAGIREQQAAADAMASYFQARTRRTVIALSIVVFLAALAFAHYSTLAPEGARRNPWSLALYFALLVTAGVVYSFATWSKFQDKYLDYRAVAEGLRVQFYWCLAGISKSVSDHYLRWQESELEWIRHALRPWSFQFSSEAGSPMPPQAARVAEERWIGEQAKYFRKNAPAKRYQVLTLETLRNVLLLASVCLAALEVLHFKETRPSFLILTRIAVLVVVGLLGWASWKHGQNLLRDPRPRKAFASFGIGLFVGLFLFATLSLTLFRLYCSPVVRGLIGEGRIENAPDAWRMVAMGLAAVLGGLIYGYAETMALSDESTQYERMDRIFENAKQTLESRPDTARRQALLEELGKEALAENGEWVLMHRQRPVQLPHA